VARPVFSSPLDDDYLWAAVHYVERNPVRAGLVRRAQDYAWSSAAVHCGKTASPVLNLESVWQKQLSAMDNWSTWLAQGDEETELRVVRRNVDKGLPCGSAEFVDSLGKKLGRGLEFRPQGRPKEFDYKIKG
jgi:putative transposase